MRVSLNITDYSWPSGSTPEALGAVVDAADEGGLDTVWVADHLVQADPRSSPEAAMLEAYTTLGFLAARSRRVRLGTMVSAATFRAPALLVKAVTTLDVLSGGRARLGIGAGHHLDEAAMMGLPMPPLPERFAHLEDVLALALQMWRGDDTAFTGLQSRLERPVNSPQCVTRPHPPILIGGMGERRTLPLVARYADACNLFDVPDGGALIRHKLDVLARHCAELGRPFAEIEKTVSTRLAPGERSADLVRRGTALAALGIEHLVVLSDAAWTPGAVRVLAGAVPALAR